MDTRSFARKLCFWGIFAVVFHERKVDIPVRHVPLDVLTISLGLDSREAIHVLVKFGRIFKILNLDGDVNNACHRVHPFDGLHLTEHIFALGRAPCLRPIERVTPVGTVYSSHLADVRVPPVNVRLLAHSGHP